MMAHPEVWKIAEQLPDWQSDLLRRVVLHGELPENQLDEVKTNLFAFLSGETGLAHGRRLSLEDLPSAAGAGDAPRLTALRDIQNVGALHADATLSFSPVGLTVVYGLNGTGKSTFSRLLKQSCRAVSGADTIHPNVFVDTASAAQRYAVEVTVGGRERRYDREVGEPPLPALGSISVFDEACAELYLSKSAALPFVPRALQCLTALVDAQKALAAHLEDRRASAQKRLPDFSSLPADTAPHRAMCGAAPDADEIARLHSLWTDEARARLAELELQLGELHDHDAERARHRERIQRIDVVSSRLESLAAATSDEALDGWQRAAHRSAELAGEVEREGRALEEMPLPGVGHPAWRDLWRSAKSFLRYVREHGGADDVCGLCHRPFDTDEVRSRMAQLEQLAEGALAREQARAGEVARQAEARLQDALRQARALREELGAPPLLLSEVAEYLGEVSERVEQALAGGVVPPPVPAPTAALTVERGEAERALEQLEQLNDPDARAELERERNELHALRILADRAEEARHAATLAVEVDELERAIAALQTTGLSRSTQKLTKTLLSERLARELERARTALGIRGLEVDLKASAPGGRPHCRLALNSKAGAKISDVFSSGERRVLGLAYFLAEVAAADHDGTIVLDDPVSSLDASRRREVARRLVEESRRRQVIVFTHDPGFYALLIRASERCGLSLTHRTLRKAGSSAGHVHDEQPWVTEKAAVLARKIRKSGLHCLRKAERDGSPEAYEQGVRAICGKLREAWERLTVEAIGEVVLPGTFDVRTRCLAKVVLDDELCRRINAAMSELSFLAHDQGTEMDRVVLSIADVERQVRDLEEAAAYLAELQRPRREAAE